jgi:hypothetical protein
MHIQGSMLLGSREMKPYVRSQDKIKEWKSLSITNVGFTNRTRLPSFLINHSITNEEQVGEFGVMSTCKHKQIHIWTSATTVSTTQIFVQMNTNQAYWFWFIMNNESAGSKLIGTHQHKGIWLLTNKVLPIYKC